jgi:hypothetical protein
VTRSCSSRCWKHNSSDMWSGTPVFWRPRLEPVAGVEGLVATELCSYWETDDKLCHPWGEGPVFSVSPKQSGRAVDTWVVSDSPALTPAPSLSASCVTWATFWSCLQWVEYKVTSKALIEPDQWGLLGGLHQLSIKWSLALTKESLAPKG